MPAQGHLYIGVRLTSQEQLETLYERFDMKPYVAETPPFLRLSDTEREELSKPDWFSCRFPATFSFEAGGRKFEVALGVHRDYDESWPLRDETDKDTYALFGFPLTSRYKGSVLDVDEPHGAPDPFEIDLPLVTEVLNDVRKAWPEAQLLLMTVEY
jgi:hypothetical protein